jgi:phosphatidylinositol alpha-1,6-mannosyltransferase
MPSRDIKGDFEGFGIVYLEANLFGKPVIAGFSGGVKDAVVDGYNGLLVDPESIEEIKKGIIKLATDPGLCRQLGEQGRIRASRDFSWEKQVEKIVQTIEQTVKEN